MKKIISLILCIVVSAMAFFSGVMAVFAMPEMKMDSNSAHYSHTEPMMDCAQIENAESSKNGHKCCFSPIKDTSISSVSVSLKENKKEKLKIDNSLFSIHYKLEESLIQKLNSPPWFFVNLKTSRTEYPLLVWIIKNNL